MAGYRPPAGLAGLDLAVVARVLVKHRANVSAAAKALKVSSSDLRRLTWSHPRLIELALEEAHRLVDRAEAKLREALDGDHADRALAAATYILSHSSAARERGWCRAGGGRDAWESPPPAATVIVQWASEGSAGYRPLAPNVPEARAAALAETDPASEVDWIH
jgi:hypothetical protein